MQHEKFCENTKMLYLCGCMSNVENKSELNIQAANLLIKNNLYAPSVHCSYYGCFQKMKSIFPKCLSMSFQDIDTKVRADKRNEHGFVIEELFNDIEAKNRLSNHDCQVLKRNVKRLKLFRQDSDYKDVCIYRNQAEEALQISNNSIDTFKKIYKV